MARSRSFYGVLNVFQYEHQQPELGLREFIPRLHQLKSDPDELLRQAGLAALLQFGEEKPMETLKTVALLERVLLLREIPIFADLSAEDLKRIAEIAHEDVQRL